MNSPASITSQSKAESRPARKPSVTAVVQRVHANAIAVCKAGMVVAAHFATDGGEVIVTMSEADFSSAFRSARDHNGNLFSAPVERVRIEDLPAPTQKVNRCKVRSPEFIAAMERINAIASGPGYKAGGIKLACAREGIAPATYYAYRAKL